MVWTVTRQRQYPDGTLCVEISKGDYNYVNPGDLGKKYPGEGETYSDPREAVKVGIAIAKAWQNDENEEVGIAVGSTGGMTLPFDPESLTKEVFDKLGGWAEDKWADLPKCGWCDSILGKRAVWSADDPDTKFCDRNCYENYEYEMNRVLEGED